MEHIPKREISLTEMTRAELKEAIVKKQEEFTDLLSEVEKCPEDAQREIAQARARKASEDIIAMYSALGANKRDKVVEMRSEDGLEREIPLPKNYKV